MEERAITDNEAEALTVAWDGERFIIRQQRKGGDELPLPRVIILNPREMLDLVKFAVTLGKE